MRRILKILTIGAGSVLGALLLLVGAMWISPDVRYSVVYVLVEYFDLNPPVTSAQLDRQIQALRHVTLIDAQGRPFDWNARPHAIIWINEWANWCVPAAWNFRP
jgi:hypothetical protein